MFLLKAIGVPDILHIVIKGEISIKRTGRQDLPQKKDGNRRPFKRDFEVQKKILPFPLELYSLMDLMEKRFSSRRARCTAKAFLPAMSRANTKKPPGGRIATK